MRVHHLTRCAKAGSLTRRMVCILIAITLLCNSTPAAAQTIVAVSNQWQVSFTFWLHASGSLARLKRLRAGELWSSTPRQASQSERNARVRRIRISPGEVTARIGEVVRFSAVAYAENGDTIGGLQFQWRASGENKDAAVISAAGEFSAVAHGRFNVSVTGAGRTAETVVTVLESEPVVKATPNDVKHFSTRNAPPPDRQQTTARPNKRSNQKGVMQKTSFNHTEVSAATSAPATLPQGADQYGWNLVNYMTADDPGSQVGDPPGTPVDGGAGNGNFQITAPVLSLPGRGINISLNLSYNAHLWHKAGGNITYDIDRGWPAPGWSFGFGKMADIGDGGTILIEADGTRHGFNGTATGPIPNSSFSGRTNDGTFIDYSCVRQNGVIIFGGATLPNGTQVHYGAAGDGAIYPTHIIDPNGNYVNVTYRNNSGPQIDTITDTLGRVINFHYNSNNLLTAVTAPRVNSGTHTIIRLHYQQQLVNPSFSVTPLVRAPATRWLLDAIYYPATSTGYWFNDSDSFLASYGMVAKVVEHRGMVHSSSGLTDMGTVTAGTMTNQAVYHWQTSTTDAPTYDTLTETWEHSDSGSAVTSYVLNPNAFPRTTTVTLPNGVKTIQYAHNASGQFNDGLVFKDETYDTDGTTLLRRNEVNWIPGDYNSARPEYTTATVRQGATYVTTGTEFTYPSTASFNQAIEVRNYGHGYVWQGTGNVLLRKTVTQYENSSNYTNRHIFNLPKVVTVYSGAGARVSQIEYTYDGGTLENAPGVIQHLDESDPYAPPITQPGHYITQCTGCPPCSCVPVWIPPSSSSPYKPETDYRGNITQLKTFADAANLDQSTAVVETRSYDMTGNMIKAGTSCCQETSFDFTTATHYAYPESETRGSSSNELAQVITSTVYDFNTGLVRFQTDANGKTSETNYFESLRPERTILSTGAHTDFAYNDVDMTVTESTYVSAHPTDTGLAAQTVKYLNGRGRTRRERALGAGGVLDFVDYAYDDMGRTTQQSLPYRSGDTKQFTSTSYDAMGRPTRVTAADGSVTEAYYNGADFDPSDSYQPIRPDAVSQIAAGDTTLVRDPWGRERWGRTDAEGRIVEVVEPNPSGNGSVATGGLVTTYSYNTLGNLTGIVQDAQTRSFKYDSLGRLTAQKLAEALAKLDDSGTYVTSGTWSDVLTYDQHSNLTSRTDARGVKTVYNYRTNPSDPLTHDPLNRLQTVSWDISGFGDTTNPILGAETITYQYRTKTSGQLRDITQIATIITANVGTESYAYDTEGRVSARTLTFNNRTLYPFVTDYTYDELDRINNLLYPAEYGNGSAARKLVHHDYDVAGRVSGLTVDSQSFASDIVYNAASQTTSMKVGVTGSNQIVETYGFAAQTGLLETQTVARTSAPSNYLVNLSYDYANGNGKRTGQLKKILNNNNHNKDRSFSYDALRRLVEAKGGVSGALWTQTYAYDRYGNRTSVTATGFSAKNERPVGPTRTDLLAKNAFEPPAFLNDGTKSLSDSPLTLFPAGANTDVFNPATGPFQSGAPTFTDDPLVAGTTTIKAIHVTELRDAINLLRLRVGLTTVSWAEAVSSGVTIKAAHITEMRTRLDQARAAIGLAATTYTDPGLAAGVTIKTAHIQEIRNSLTAAWNTSSQISRDGHASLSYENSSNRITTAGFAYDAAGNQVRALTATGTASRYFQYDAANRLVKVKANDNSTVLATYTYGCSRARLTGEEEGVRTYYVGDGGPTVAEFTESGGSVAPAWSKSYVYLGNRLLSTLTPNAGSAAVEHHHPDQLGTRVVTNPAAGTSFEQVNLPFGTPLTAESTGATTRRFTSYERSSANVGLDYAINRSYDPQQGRFTQVDPAGMGSTNLENPQSFNLYTYVKNDPINSIDPDGLGLGSFFKKIGRFFSAVGNAISKVLNNRWVRIGIFVASFLVGIPAVVAFLGKTVTAIINTVLTIHNTLSNLASTLQLYGALFQGKFKEFGRAVGAGIVSAAVSIIEDSVIQGIKDSIRNRGVSLRNVWTGVKEGFSRGWDKFAHNLLKRGLESLVPFYGNFCSPGNVDSDSTPAVDAIDALCKVHDKAYQGRTPGVTKYEADKTLFVGLLHQTAKAHLTDRLVNLAFGTRINGGDVYRSLQILAFGSLIGYRAVTGRKN